MLGKKVRWKVSLNNGETLYEEKGNYKTIEGELSPWNRLLQYIENNELKITSIGLYTDDGENFHLPSNGNRPKFSLFADLESPLEYKFFRAVSSSSENDYGLYSVIEAQYKDYKLQMWVDEYSKNCWSACIKV